MGVTGVSTLTPVAVCCERQWRSQSELLSDIQTTGQETKKNSILPEASLSHTIFGMVRSSLLP